MEKGDPAIMERHPRPTKEPIVNATMRLGIIIQTFAQTFATLGAFAIGLIWHLRAGDHLAGGENPILYLLQYDWRGVDVLTAETMAFATLSLCELFRAYTARSERLSIFRLGIFANRYMQYAVGFSVALLLIVVNVPFLQPVFNTHFLSLREWAVVIAFALIPAISEELTKLYLRLKAR